MDWVYTLSGFLVGLIVGITGVGGGSLMTPLLVLVFGVSPATAVGTDLLYASLTKSLGGWVHGRRGSVDWKVVGLLALGSLPAAVVTIALLKYLALDEKTLRSLVTSVLSVALLLTAAALLLKSRIKKIARRKDGTVYELHHRYLPAATIATGFVVGALVTVSSVGAGVLGTVALLFLYPRMPAVKVVGTDIVHAVPLTAVAGMGHMALGTVDHGAAGQPAAGLAARHLCWQPPECKVAGKGFAASAGDHVVDYRRQDGAALVKMSL